MIGGHDPARVWGKKWGKNVIHLGQFVSIRYSRGRPKHRVNATFCCT
jgi:hypothetical protein